MSILNIILVSYVIECVILLAVIVYDETSRTHLSLLDLALLFGLVIIPVTNIMMVMDFFIPLAMNLIGSKLEKILDKMDSIKVVNRRK